MVVEGRYCFSFALLSLTTSLWLAWRRSVAWRMMQPGALTKATVLEVSAADAVDKTVLDPDLYIKCWDGFLRRSQLDHVQPLTQSTRTAPLPLELMRMAL